MMNYLRPLSHLVVWMLFLTLVFVCRADRKDALSASINHFTLDLYREMAKRQTGSFVFSGLGADMLMSIILTASSGDTSKQLKRGLRYSGFPTTKLGSSFRTTLKTLDSHNGENLLKFVNSVWINDSYQINQNFSKATTDNFFASVESINFRSGKTAQTIINNWVDNSTQGLIPDIFQRPLDGFTKTILVNLVYFKGRWENRFLVEDTSNQLFHSQGNSTPKTVPMMNRVGVFPFKRDKYNQVSVLEINYQRRSFTMTIVLPDHDTDIRDVERKLSFDSFQNMLDNKKKMAHVNVTIPRFEMQSAFDLRKPLAQLGIKDAFSFKANLPDLGQFVFVSKIVQKAKVKVNEEGSGAAVKDKNGDNSKGRCITFRADRPFIYVIQDKRSDVVLLMGRVTAVE